MSADPFKNKIRVRVNGILQQEEKILLVQLQSPVSDELVWMPPGGGLEFGESMDECLQREFSEETGLQVNIGSFCFMNELIKPPFHAVEFYFSVEKTGGDLHMGIDPELKSEDQLLKDIQWIDIDDLEALNFVPHKLEPWLQETSHNN